MPSDENGWRPLMYPLHAARSTVHAEGLQTGLVIAQLEIVRRVACGVGRQ